MVHDVSAAVTVVCGLIRLTCSTLDTLLQVSGATHKGRMLCADGALRVNSRHSCVWTHSLTCPTFDTLLQVSGATQKGRMCCADGALRVNSRQRAAPGSRARAGSHAVRCARPSSWAGWGPGGQGV